MSFSESFSVLHQPDIDLWSSSAVSGIIPPGEDIFPVPQDLFTTTEMAHFHEQYFAKSESGSSMDDSAYVSHADTGSRSVPHDNLINQSFEQFLCSPALSSVSQAGFQGSQFALSDAATDSTVYGPFTSSEASIYPNSSTFSSPTTLDMSHTFNSRAWSTQSLNGAFVSPMAPGSYFQQPTINPQFANNPYYNGGDKPTATMKRAQISRPHVDTNLSASNLTSPSPVSGVRPARPASARSSSAVDMSLGGSTAVDVHYEQSAGVFQSSLRSPSTQSITEFKDEDLDDESLSVPLSASGQLAEDAESKMARTHPLYQATPGDDDLYHCPQEGKPGCNHKATKLKCNYDKYVDSHLRPYKCKITSCEGIQFSSTACLLRHEREAHGMHGHGSKPNLCSFSDCERSIPGNGFPRRYNLYDHMKRVHDYTPSAASPDELSPTVASGKRSVNRKRKASGNVEEVGEKRQKVIVSRVQPEPIVPQKDLRAEQVKELRSQWAQRHFMTQQRLQSLQDPLSMQYYSQLSEDLVFMQQIAQKITDLSG